MRKWQLVVALFVLAATAGLHAYTAGLSFWQHHSTKNIIAKATLSDSQMTYVKVRIQGQTDWAEGNASNACWPSSCAQAQVEIYEPAGGGFTAEGHYYTNHEKREEKTSTKWFDPIQEEEEICEIADTETGECISPIIIPTGNSQAYRMTPVADGVLFDIRADGTLPRVSWTQPDAELAFLAIDRNKNGRIDDGSELLGERTLPGVGNGFDALAQLGSHNGDGALDAQDALFGELLLWTDRNHNGVSEADELRPASDVLEAIGLGYFFAQRRDGAGNRFAYRGWARRVGAGESFGREFKIFDVFLRVQ